MTLRLLTIPISHYCEKARWALERIGLAYREERHLQGFHYPRSYWLGRNPNVPILLDGDAAIVDSTAILQHLERYAPAPLRLYPEQAEARRQVEELEDVLDDTLGVESRRWFYFHYLPEGKAALRLAGQGVPVIERALAPLVFPFMRRYATWLLDVSTRSVEAGLQRARDVMRQTDAMLEDGRPFLVGEAFTAADLTLACMMSPFVVPPESGVRLPSLGELPEAARDTVRSFRQTRSGEHALKMFREHRRALRA